MIRLVRRTLAACGALVTGLAAVWSAYLGIISLAARRARSSGRAATPLAPQPRTRFRVLVPAHNEETLIAETMEGLQKLDYPKGWFSVHVVADNCTDRTAAIVRDHGFEAHERHDPQNPGKGPALGWLIDGLDPDESTDAAFVLIDADTSVDPLLLRVFDSHLTSGVDVVQGYYAVRAAEQGGHVGFRAAALAVRHYVRPLGRVELGGSSGLYGNGMAFRETVARRHRFSDHLVEDIEMGLNLLLEGGRVGYAADAVVEAEMPESLDDAASQNERWEAGRGQIVADFAPRLASAAATADHGRRWPYVDALLDLTLPPFTALAAITGLGGAVIGLAGRGRAAIIGAGVAALALAVQVAHVLGALRMTGAPAAVYRSLLLAPVHMAWKLVLLVRLAVRRGPQAWVRTTRNDEGSS